MIHKLRTAAMVLILSGLIWVVAERAVRQRVSVRALVEVIHDRDDLLLEYLDQNGNLKSAANSVELALEVEGPSGRVQGIRGQMFRLRVPLDMEKYPPPTSTSRDYSLSVTEDLLKRGLPYNDGFLTVIKSDPPGFSIRISSLVKQTLPVRVYSADGIELTRQTSMEPAAVDAYVLPGQPAEARIDLTADQQRKAGQTSIQVPVQVIFAGHQAPKFTLPVELKLVEKEDTWPITDIKLPRVGVILPLERVGRWKVVLDKADDLKEYAPIKFRGPAQAVKEYSESQYHLVLEIRETDTAQQPIYRPLRYYLPQNLESSIEILEHKQIPIQCHREAIEKTP